MTTYEYRHRAGYGRDDHMADEIIARAARHLGLAGAGAYVMAAVGLAAHFVPMGAARVQIASAPGVRRRMERALLQARSEVRLRDTRINVVCVRRRVITDCGARYRIEEHRRGNEWVTVTTDLVA